MKKKYFALVALFVMICTLVFTGFGAMDIVEAKPSDEVIEFNLNTDPSDVTEPADSEVYFAATCLVEDAISTPPSSYAPATDVVSLNTYSNSCIIESPIGNITENLTPTPTSNSSNDSFEVFYADGRPWFVNFLESNDSDGYTPNGDESNGYESNGYETDGYNSNGVNNTSTASSPNKSYQVIYVDDFPVINFGVEITEREPSVNIPVDDTTTGDNTDDDTITGDNINGDITTGDDNNTEEPVIDPSVTYQDVNTTVYATSTVNVYGGPNENYGVLGTLNLGDSIVRTGIGSNGWSRVSYNGQMAYVYTGYLSLKELVAVPENKSDMHVGRLTIPSVGVDIALYTCPKTSEYLGIQQSIIDDSDSGFYAEKIIADHADQGFSAMKNAVPYETYAYIDHGTYTQKYVCIAIGNGMNYGTDLVDWDGTSLMNGNVRGGLAMYTCNDSVGQSVTISYWQPV